MDYKYINKCYPQEEISAVNIIEHKVFTNLQLTKISDIHNICQQLLYNIWTAVFHWIPAWKDLNIIIYILHHWGKSPKFYHILKTSAWWKEIGN